MIPLNHPPYLPGVGEVLRGPAVAGYGEVAGLAVQGKQGEVHGAGHSEGDLAPAYRAERLVIRNIP